MDVTNLTKANSVVPIATKATRESSGNQSSAPVGNSLPDAGQARVHVEESADANPVPTPSPEELNNLVSQANVTLQQRSSDLKFTIAEGTDISIVRVEDSETGEVIRQFPSEEMVTVARVLREAQQGMMLEEKV